MPNYKQSEYTFEDYKNATHKAEDSVSGFDGIIFDEETERQLFTVADDILSKQIITREDIQSWLCSILHVGITMGETKEQEIHRF